MDLLDSLPYFSIGEVRNIFPGKADVTVRAWLSSSHKKWTIHRLKKWLYVSDVFWKYKKDSGYSLFIANQLDTPSYISTHSALDYYGVLSESSFGITCVTCNKTSGYQNIAWSFYYRHIKSVLFCWFEEKKIARYQVFMATKAKALFDYFWYMKKKISSFTRAEIESYRLNLDRMNQEDLQELEHYVLLSGSQKMKKIYFLIVSLCGS